MLDLGAARCHGDATNNEMWSVISLLKCIWILLLVLLIPSVSAFSATKSSINFVPSQVELVNVCQQFPITWQRRFLSSVPIRDYALRNISLALDSHQLVLIQGASSSGKSTLLKTILEPQKITSGQVYVKTTYSSLQPHQDGDDHLTTTAAAAAVARPIYLDHRPPLEGRRSMQKVLEQDRPPRMDTALYEAMVETFAVFLGFTVQENWLLQRVSDLSPSENYRFAILRACLQSSCSEDVEVEDAAAATTAAAAANNVILVPAPILLLDEWMDTETSTVVQATQKSLFDLVRSTGGLVCFVTHKVDRWKADWVNRSVTLCRGEVLSLYSR